MGDGIDQQKIEYSYIKIEISIDFEKYGSIDERMKNG